MNPYFVVVFSGCRRQLRGGNDALFTLMFYVFLIIAWSSIWWAATRAAGGEVYGFRYENILWYIITTQASVIVASARRIEHIGKEIADGDVEIDMLHPVSVVGVRIAREFGESLGRLCYILPTGLLLGVLYLRGVPNVVTSMLAIPAVVLAAACNVVAIHAFASLSFWNRDAKAAWFLFQKCIFMLGGMLLPLQFLPHGLQVVAWCLPFWAMAYSSGRLAAGFFEPWLLLGQITWLVFLMALACGLFALGERRVQRGVV